jgi:DNA-binding HxlR family transcriptional regulator
MEKKGLIKRKVYDETPIRIEYIPTEKGYALKSLINSMAIFSTKYFSNEIFLMENQRI